MSGAELAALGFVVALGAMFLRMPIGSAMLLTGLAVAARTARTAGCQTSIPQLRVAQ